MQFLKKIPEDIPNDIDSGYFIINGRKYINMIELPMNEYGEIEIVVETMYGKELHFTGTKISTEEIGDMKFLDNFKGFT